MPTICSAICKAMRVGDDTVGTSTICSADCGSGTRERDGHGEQEILGTSTTCSAIGRSRIRKVSVTSPTICGTRRSRICTNGQMEPRSSMTCRTTLPCLPATSDRGAGTPPPGSSSRLKSSGWGVGGFRTFAVEFCSCPHTPALAILCPLEEWCENSAKAMATVIHSCRNMERSRRALRRRATPLDCGRPLGSAMKNCQVCNKQVVVVVVVRTDDLTHVFLHMSQ